jgi:hypothetical protein
MEIPRVRCTKRAALITLVSFALLIFGCSKKARIYNLTTGEVVPAQFSYNGTGKGTLTAVTASGEKLKGEYVTLAGGQVSWGSIYASVYGPKGSASGSGSSFASSTEAKQRGTAIATGDKGTIIQCEYITSVWNGGGTGACKDNHDVLYKLMF